MTNAERPKFPLPVDKWASDTLTELGQRENMFTPLGNLSWLGGLSRIKRFSMIPEMVHRTDLWTHSRRTAFMSCFLADLPDPQVEIDRHKMFHMGYHHDDPEIITTDLPTPVKRSMSPEEKQKLGDLEDGTIKTMAVLFGSNDPEGYLSRYQEMKRKETPESQFVDISDKLDGLGETMHEIRCGNSLFLPVLESYYATLEGFNRYPMWDTLRKHPAMQLEVFPSQEEADSIPKIKPEDLRDKNTAWAKLLEGKIPTFYKTWLELSISIFDRRTEKFVLPGWYLELWKYWGDPHGVTSSSGLYIL